MTEVRCSHCGRFLMATNAPWGRVTAYCKGCRVMRSVSLGKAPADEQRPAVIVRIDRIKQSS